MAKSPPQNVQDVFLGHVRRGKSPVTIFLVNGVKLQGVISWFDDNVVLLRRDGHTQLVYKHAISTVMPLTPLTIVEVDDKASIVQSSVNSPSFVESNQSFGDDIY